MRDVYTTNANPPQVGECFTSPLGVVEYRWPGNFEDPHTCDRCAFEKSEVCRNVACVTRREGYYYLARR